MVFDEGETVWKGSIPVIVN